MHLTLFIHRCTKMMFTDITTVCTLSIFVTIVMNLQHSVSNVLGASVTGNASSNYGVLNLVPVVKETQDYTWHARDMHPGYEGIHFVADVNTFCEQVSKITMQPCLNGGYGNEIELPFCDPGVEFLVKFGNMVGFRLNFSLHGHDRNGTNFTAAVQIFWTSWSSSGAVLCNGVLCRSNKEDHEFICIDDDWRCGNRMSVFCAYNSCNDFSDDEEPIMLKVLRYLGLAVGVIVICICCWLCLRTGQQSATTYGNGGRPHSVSSALGIFFVGWVRNSLRNGQQKNRPKPDFDRSDRIPVSQRESQI